MKYGQLQEILNELRQDYGDKIMPISLDLSNIEAIYKLKNMLEQKQPESDILLIMQALQRFLESWVYYRKREIS